MGLQEMAKLQLHHHGAMRAADDDGSQAAVGGRRKKATAAAVWIAVPLRPVKVGRRRHGGETGEKEKEKEKEEEDVEEVTTPRGEGCTIPWEATTCPPAPKKARTRVAIFADRRCNRDDGEVTEYFRVPADLDSVFAVSLVAEAN